MAVKATACKHYDVILMDCQMPILDGLEATQYIRNLDMDQQPVIIAPTADAFAEIRQACLQAGIDD